jgi:phosphatidylinositol glycan class B
VNLKTKYLWIAAAVYLVTAYFSLGHLHPDEYYQILEFAAYKLNLNSPQGLTWEFYQQIRPTIQAWGVVYLYNAIELITKPNPFLVAFFTRVISAILSLYAIVLFINTFKDELKTPKKQQWFILLSLFSWLALLNSVRYSSENIAGKLFLIGLCLAYSAKFRKDLIGYVVIGILLGLSFLIRFQVGIMIVGLIAWMLIIKRTPIKYLSTIVIFIFVIIGFGSVLDHAFYGSWVFTPWRYFAVNLIQGKAETFSSDPWYFYLSIAALLPYGAIFILASIYFIYAKPKHVITWIMLPFIVVHIIIAHKEPRFLTPLLSFMPFVILYSLQILGEKYSWYLGHKLIKLNNIAWKLNLFAVSVVMFFPIAMQIRINELIYKKYIQPTAFNYITDGGNILDFYKHLNLRPVKMDNPQHIDCKASENCIIALTCPETIKYGVPDGKLIFSDCHEWLYKFNFNDWLDRTALYNIYEIHSIESTR